MLNVDERTAAQVAALLTIAATQNMQPMPEIQQNAHLVAETVGRIYEQMLEKVIQIYSRSG